MRRTVVQVVLTDDLDAAEKDAQTTATRTRQVGLDGEWRELDLTDEHDAELAELIGRYMRAGRKPTRPPVPPGKRHHPVDGSSPLVQARLRNQAVVEWAQAQGQPITERVAGGWYIPVATQRAYDAAHPPQAGAA